MRGLLRRLAQQTHAAATHAATTTTSSKQLSSSSSSTWTAVGMDSLCHPQQSPPHQLQQLLQRLHRSFSSSMSSSSCSRRTATWQQQQPHNYQQQQQLQGFGQCRSYSCSTSWQTQLQQQQHHKHQRLLLLGSNSINSSSSSMMGVRCWQQGAAAAAAAAAAAGYKTAADQARARNRKGIVDGGLYLGAIVLGMIGFSYASVPLYRAFCQATGYGGTVSQTHNIEAKLKAREDNPNASLEERARQREIRVWFTADVADDMPWRFTPTQEYVTVHPGESVLAFFTAHNRSPHAITGVSTYNVVPDKAAYYFNKIQCFCFEEQRLRPGEEVDMPVFFYLDPEMVDDFNCRNVHDITLSYTFFKVDEDEDATADADTDAAPGSGIKLHGPGQLPPGIAGLPPTPGAAAAPVAAAVSVAAGAPVAAAAAGTPTAPAG